MNIHEQTPTEYKLANSLCELAFTKVTDMIGQHGETFVADRLGLSKIGLRSLQFEMNHSYGVDWDLAKMIRVLDCLDDNMSLDILLDEVIRMSNLKDNGDFT